jgi:hypothetical protein
MEADMKAGLGLFAAVALADLSASTYAQAPPPGSYQRTCRDLRMQGIGRVQSHEPRYNYMRKNFSAIVGYKVAVT